MEASSISELTLTRNKEKPKWHCSNSRLFSLVQGSLPSNQASANCGRLAGHKMVAGVKGNWNLLQVGILSGEIGRLLCIKWGTPQAKQGFLAWAREGQSAGPWKGRPFAAGIDLKGELTGFCFCSINNTKSSLRCQLATCWDIKGAAGWAEAAARETSSCPKRLQFKLYWPWGARVPAWNSTGTTSLSWSGNGLCHHAPPSLPCSGTIAGWDRAGKKQRKKGRWQRSWPKAEASVLGLRLGSFRFCRRKAAGEGGCCFGSV